MYHCTSISENTCNRNSLHLRARNGIMATAFVPPAYLHSTAIIPPIQRTRWQKNTTIAALKGRPAALSGTSPRERQLKGHNGRHPQRLGMKMPTQAMRGTTLAGLLFAFMFPPSNIHGTVYVCCPAGPHLGLWQIPPLPLMGVIRNRCPHVFSTSGSRFLRSAYA